MDSSPFRRKLTVAPPPPPRQWGDGRFDLARLDGSEAFGTDRSHWFSACALAYASKWEPAGTSLATPPAADWQQAPQTAADARAHAIEAHFRQWHGSYADIRGQVIEAWDANRLALGIRRGLERMATIHWADYGTNHDYRFTIAGCLVPNLSGGFHPQSLPADAVPVYAFVNEATHGREYFLELASFLEEGAVRLTPST
jgi:hypothetical protein